MKKAQQQEIELWTFHQKNNLCLRVAAFKTECCQLANRCLRCFDAGKNTHGKGTNPICLIKKGPGLITGYYQNEKEKYISFLDNKSSAINQTTQSCLHHTTNGMKRLTDALSPNLAQLLVEV